jgi:hypothetical protein
MQYEIRHWDRSTLYTIKYFVRNRHCETRRGLHTLSCVSTTRVFSHSWKIFKEREGIYVYIYIYIYIYIHTYIHTHVHAFMYTYTRARIHVNVHTHAYAYPHTSGARTGNDATCAHRGSGETHRRGGDWLDVCTYVCICIYVHTHTHIYICILRTCSEHNIYIYTYIYKYIYIYIYIYIHTYIHTNVFYLSYLSDIIHFAHNIFILVLYLFTCTHVCSHKCGYAHNIHRYTTRHVPQQQRHPSRQRGVNQTAHMSTVCNHELTYCVWMWIYMYTHTYTATAAGWRIKATRTRIPPEPMDVDVYVYRRTQGGSLIADTHTYNHVSILCIHLYTYT